MTATLQRNSSEQVPPPKGTPSLPSAPARTRVPVILLGLLIVLGAGIGFALWSTDLNSRESVLVAARPIQAGDLIVASDFRTQELGGATDVASIPVANAPLFYGTIAVADIAEGAVVNRFQFAESGGLEPGQAIVGMMLDSGANPVPRLRIGDRVQVVRTSNTEQVAEIIAEAEVYAVRVASEVSATVVVSLVVPQDRVVDVADAAGADRIRLVLVPGEN